MAYPEARMTYLQAAHCPDGESPAHEVAEIPIYPAAICSYAHDRFRNEKRIQALYIGARKNRLKPTAKARAEDVLPLIGTRSGMREIYVVVAWHSQGYKRRDRERTGAQVVPQVYSHVLKVAVIVPIVNRQLVGSRSVVLGKHKRDTDIHRQLVRDSEINVLDENEGADVADIQPCTTRAKMVLDKVVLQGKRCRPFTLCRNPGLAGGKKRQEQDKACKGNERSQDLCSAHGVPATYQLLPRRCRSSPLSFNSIALSSVDRQARFLPDGLRTHPKRAASAVFSSVPSYTTGITTVFTPAAFTCSSTLAAS